jgi:exonuclease III
MINGNDQFHASTLNLKNIVLKSAFKSRSTGFNFCHLNALSIPAHISQIRNLTLNVPLHVIAVSESWLTNKHSTNSYYISGYNCIRKDREDGLRGGGVAIYYHESLKISRTVSKSSKKCLTEHLFIEFENSSSEKLLIGVVYNHPRHNIVKNLEKVLTSISETYQNILILGDMNINLLSECSETKKFKSH